MDKINELHKEAATIDYFSHQVDAHATITEDLMGRFAEWAENEGWSYYRGSGKWRRSPEAHTTSELIQLFKETL